MSRLPDGCVIPHFLGLEAMGRSKSYDDQTNLSLRWGEVQSIVYPSAASNTGMQKKYIEYVVMVAQQDGDGSNVNTFYNCVSLNNVFGSVADILKYTLRTTAEGDPPQLGEYGEGAKVLLLCINGDTAQAVILGGTRDATNDDNVDQQSDGHNLEFEFNGLNVAINNAGELAVTFNGATNADGSLADSADTNAQGSVLRMTQDGSISFTSADALQSVLIDQTNNVVTVAANSQLNLKCAGQVNIQSSGIVMGGGNNAMPLFSNYRFSETEMNTVAASQAQAIGVLLGTAGAALASASGASAFTLAQPFLATAGASLTAAAPLLEAWGAAVTAFEAQATTYVSRRNFND
jgi:hypothetical protein